jgi:hypothetical protein
MPSHNILSKAEHIRFMLLLTVCPTYLFTYLTGKGLNSGPYRQLSDNLKSGSISEFRYEDLDLGGSFDGEGGYGMGNIRGSESDLVGIGAVHSQWQLTRYVQYLLFNGGGVTCLLHPQSSHLTFLCLFLYLNRCVLQERYISPVCRCHLALLTRPRPLG